MSERLLPSEVKAKRRRLQGRARIPKRDLTELATALREFESLSPADQEWVRREIEAHDNGVAQCCTCLEYQIPCHCMRAKHLSPTHACTHGIVPESACTLCRRRA